jgi:hypothetical protein
MGRESAHDVIVPQLLVTVCVIPVLFFQVTFPPVFTVAPGNGALLLTMLTWTSEAAADALTVTVPFITE